ARDPPPAKNGLRRPARALVPRLARDAPRGDAPLAPLARARDPRRAGRAAPPRRAQERHRLAVRALQPPHARALVPHVDRWTSPLPREAGESRGGGRDLTD